MPSEQAEKLVKEAFPSDDGLPALLVFHEESEISEETKEKIVELSEWFETENKPEQITSSIPFHHFPEEVQEEFLSEDLSTLLFHVSLEEGIEASETNAVMDTLRDKVEEIKISEETKEKIVELSEWFETENKPEQITSSIPFHHFPEEVQEEFLSEDLSTLLFHVSLEEGIEASETNAVMDTLRDKVEEIGFENVQFEITGPAGISADTISIFQNTDFVLIIATVLLIFVLLILISRPPLLAITPLVIAGIVYGVVDRVIGIFGAANLFAIDSQAISIMLVLMFAVLTDYSLFIFSRYREKLRTVESKYVSMQQAMYHVSEPIFFSGSTIFLAMLTLFVTIFKPYNYFAPVFSTAVIFILLAGLTLIPSIRSEERRVGKECRSRLLW